MTALERKFSPFSLSLFIHGTLVACVILFQVLKPSASRRIPIEVIEYPQAPSAHLQLQPSKPLEKPKKELKPETKQVFGVSRKAIQTETPTANTAEVKAGNTVAKEMDNLKLEANDADSIPIPADDYLVTSMPVLTSEVRIPYPAEAKAAGVEGPVVMDLIIDDQGKVRQVTLIRGPGYGLNEAAVEAIQKFSFRPAKIEDKSVAVKIRYTYRFVLENR